MKWNRRMQVQYVGEFDVTNTATATANPLTLKILRYILLVYKTQKYDKTEHQYTDYTAGQTAFGRSSLQLHQHIALQPDRDQRSVPQWATRISGTKWGNLGFIELLFMYVTFQSFFLGSLVFRFLCCQSEISAVGRHMRN